MEGFGDLSILVTTGTPSWFQTAKKTNRPKARKKLDSIETRKCMTSDQQFFFFEFFQVIQSGLLIRFKVPFLGWLSDPFKGSSDLQLGPGWGQNPQLPQEVGITRCLRRPRPMQFMGKSRCSTYNCWTTVGAGWHWWMARRRRARDWIIPPK